MITHPNLIKAALTADALCLGPHWIYDQSKLTRSFPNGISSLTHPITNYHPGKSAGDFTHYGDHLSLLLRSYSITKTWDPTLHTQTWQAFWKNTTSYQDGSTKQTLAHLQAPENNPPSTSNDSAGAAIALGLIAFFDHRNQDDVITAVRQRTTFTHNDPETVDSAEFFTRVILDTLNGTNLPDALENAAKINYPSLDAAAYLTKAKASLTQEDHLKVATDFGLSCHHSDAFPLALSYLLRHPNDLPTALSENALAGGDNSARAIIIAIVLTAANEWPDELESRWQELNQHPELNNLLP